jgi:DNA-directed RNA polymerase specialized sigma24 family protein
MTFDDPWDPLSPEWSKRLAFVRRVLSSSQYELTAEDREELAQEALVDLFERSRSERPRNPEGLLRIIAHNKAVDLFRARKRWRLIIDASDPALHDAADPCGTVDYSVRARLLESLPAIAQTYFTQHHPECLPHARTYFEGGAWKDLAAETDQRVNTVIQQWTRCRGGLVAHLRVSGFGWILGEDGRDG